MTKKQEPKSFEDKLKDGDIYDIPSAARQSGYNEVYLRRLCHAKKIKHLKRGKSYFFTPDMIKQMFEEVA